MVFVKFDLRGRWSMYFVGVSLPAVLDDVKGFIISGEPLPTHTEISEEEARKIDLGFLDEGLDL
jgi:hypothetical protein